MSYTGTAGPAGLKRQELLNQETGKALIEHLSQLILSLVIKEQEYAFFKKMKSSFEDSEVNKSGYIYAE